MSIVLSIIAAIHEAHASRLRTVRALLYILHSHLRVPVPVVSVPAFPVMHLGQLAIPAPLFE